MSHFQYMTIEGFVSSLPIKNADNKITCTIDTNTFIKGEKTVSTFKVIADGKLGDNLIKYLEVGSRILVSGRPLPTGGVYAKEVNFLTKK